MEDKENKKKSIVECFCMISAIGIGFYNYFSHFNYPFSSTLFLYFGFAMAICALLLSEELSLPFDIFPYLLIVLLTWIGSRISTNKGLGDRQAQFFTIYFVFFWLAMKNTLFVCIIKKVFLLFSIIGTITVFVQFVVPGPFNEMLMHLYRSDAYELVMWSFNVDGTYMGLMSSVSMASFSMAIIFFEMVEKMENDSQMDVEQGGMKNVYRGIVCIVSLFGIILTSKRGIFIATIFAFLVYLVLGQKIKKIKLNSTMLVIGYLGLITLTIGGGYLISTNEYISAFIARFSGGNITTGRDVFYNKAFNDIFSGGISVFLFGRGTGAAYSINRTGLHNVYIQIIYDHGLVGGILYGIFFISNFRRAIIENSYFSVSLQALFLFYCLTGNPLYDYYFFIPYLLYSCYKGENKSTSNEC